MLNDEFFKKLYSDCYSDPTYKMGAGRVVNVMRAVLSCAQAVSVHTGRSALSLLDVGCGRGEVLQCCASGLSGNSITFPLLRGMEIVPELTGTFDGYAVDLIPSIARTAAHGKYDIVVCSDVLEHIPEEDAATSVKKLFDLACGFVILHVAWFSHVWRTTDGANVELHVNRMPLSYWTKLVTDVNPRGTITSSVDFGNQTGIIVSKVG